MTLPLFLTVFAVAICGLVYELIAGTLASYLLGDSITQFSTVIGVYLFSMGVGSYLSKHIHRNLEVVFIRIELILGLIGGFSAAALFLSFDHVASFRVFLYLTVFVIGSLVGTEIPLLMRILKDKFEFKDLVSQVLTFDYIGALFASILFPLVLVPHLGLVKSSLLFGIINAAVGVWTIRIFKDQIGAAKGLKAMSYMVLGLLLIGFVYSEKLVALAEAPLYTDPIVYAESSPYQRIIITRNKSDVSLFLNGHLQFNSRDEYRYHEALVHVGLSSLQSPKKILILGGGDGLALREVLKYPSVEHVTQVDLDAAVIEIFSKIPILTELNQNSFDSKKVNVINKDAFVWLQDNKEKFDFILMDFPDPTNYSVGKLYTTTFFKLLQQALAPKGIVTIQSTSPLFARQSYWCINNTLQSIGLKTKPYHLYVPTFGEWGFVIASNDTIQNPTTLPEKLKFLTLDHLETMFYFPPDMAHVNTEINRLNNQILVRYYEDEWSRYTTM